MRKLGEANIFLSIYPTAKYGAQTLGKKELGTRTHLHAGKFLTMKR